MRQTIDTTASKARETNGREVILGFWVRDLAQAITGHPVCGLPAFFSPLSALNARVSVL